MASGVELVHTGRLPAAVLEQVRELLYAAFDDLDETDVEHALGGTHALVWDGPVLLAHAALVQRRLLHGGRALRAGYVEAVAVRASARRQGHGTAVMAALEELAGAYDLLALGSTDEGAALYAGRGWQNWRGPLSALTPDGVVRTPEDDGGVWVLPGAAPLDLDAALTADWREGDVW